MATADSNPTIADTARAVREVAEGAVQQLVVLLANFTARMNVAAREDKVDAGYHLKKAAELFDECRKESNAFQNLLGKLLAFEAIKAATADPTASMVFRGRDASAIPDIKQRFKFPKKGTPEYEALMKKLGVPDEMARRGVFNFDFADASDYFALREAEGDPLLKPGGHMFSEYTCTWRPIKTK